MNRFHGEHGSVTAWMVMVPVLVLLLCGLATDLWLATSVRARMAAMADDAAAAGATAVTSESLRAIQARLDTDVATDRATTLLAGHGDRHLVDRHQVTIAGDVVTVSLWGRADLLLLRMLGPDHVPVSVSGAARPIMR